MNYNGTDREKEDFFIITILGSIIGAVVLSIAFAIYDAEYRTPLLPLLTFIILLFVYPGVFIVHYPLFYLKKNIRASHVFWLFMYLVLGMILGPIYANILKTNFHWVYIAGGIGAGFGTWLADYFFNSKNDIYSKKL